MQQIQALVDKATTPYYFAAIAKLRGYDDGERKIERFLYARRIADLKRIKPDPFLLLWREIKNAKTRLWSETSSPDNDSSINYGNLSRYKRELVSIRIRYERGVLELVKTKQLPSKYCDLALASLLI